MPGRRRLADDHHRIAQPSVSDQTAEQAASRSGTTGFLPAPWTQARSRSSWSLQRCGRPGGRGRLPGPAQWEAHAIPAHSNSRNLPLPAGNHLQPLPVRRRRPSGHQGDAGRHSRAEP